MKIAAFLPAKGSSERILSKNTALIDSKPLFLYTLEKLCGCSFIDEVYLDSDSDEILEYAPYLGYIPLKRDASLATNKTDGHKLFMNEADQVEADIYIQILCTSPFIKEETIKKGIDTLLEHPEYDSAVLVKKEKQYLWSEGKPIYNIENIPNSKDLPDAIIETMGLYIVRRECAFKERKRIGKHPFLLEASPIEAVDINYPEDFVLAETIARGLRSFETEQFKFWAKHITTPMLSDIMDDMGMPGIISSLRPNIETGTIMGRANTLKLRKLKDGEDYRGIYDALSTYDKIRAGEIIAVENEIGNYAYFGELNANLAIRSGAIGAIIGGVTRDFNNVRNLLFPVFSKGNCCIDVRKRAVMESHNQPVTIDGVRIIPGDIIVADKDGIAVIPQNRENDVLSKAIKTIQKENGVKNAILNGLKTLDIINQNGEF